MKIQHIAVIGVGMAGISCAKKLLATGKKVTLFDKSARPGGRMSSRIFEHWCADHGAQYFTAKGDSFKNTSNSWLKDGLIQPWLGKIVSYKKNEVLDVDQSVIRYVGVPAMNSLPKALVEDMTVHYSQTICKVEKVDDSWILFSKENGQIQTSFDLIIFAIPPKQAADLIPNDMINIYEAFSNVKMLPCWTLITYLDNHINLPFDGAFMDEEPFSWIARNNSKPFRAQDESWTAQASPEWSSEYINQSNSEVESILVRAFEEIIGQPIRRYQSHLWRYAKVESPSDESFILDQDHRIGICGDWLVNSTIEGAWTSGLMLANEINSFQP
jgi:hypothetical protein